VVVVAVGGEMMDMVLAGNLQLVFPTSRGLPQQVWDFDLQ